MVRSLRRQAKGLFILVTLGALVVFAAIGDIFFETSGISQFKYFNDTNNMPTVSTTLQSYEVFREYTGNGSDNIYLVDTKITRDVPLEAEGVSGSVSWTVRGGKHLENILWSQTEAGTLLDYNHEFNLVVSGVEGCCAEMTGYRAYDLKSGKLIVSYNNYFVLSVPNSQLKPRFIGIITGDSTRDRDFVDPVFGSKETALVKYTSLGGSYQKIQIDMKVADGFAPSILEMKIEKDSTASKSNSIEIDKEKATLWNIDGATSASQIEGVVLKMVLSGGEDNKTVLIPIDHDQLNLNRAQVPGGVSIRPL